MTTSSLQESIIQMVADLLSLRTDDVQLSHTLFEDLKMDELDKMELILALEEQFGIEISDDDTEKFTTVQDVVDCLSSFNLNT